MSMEYLQHTLKNNILWLMKNEKKTLKNKINFIDEKIQAYKKLKDECTTKEMEECYTKMISALLSCENILLIVEKSEFTETEAYALMSYNCCNKCNDSICVKVCKGCSKRLCKDCFCDCL